MPEIAAELDQRGFCLVPNIVDNCQIDELKPAFAANEIARAERGGQTYGARNLLHLPEVRALADGQKVRSCLLPLLGPGFRVVRGLFFDKTEGANWPVPWHQDLSLAVQERRDLPGWDHWTVKRGVTHVQPPADILSRMITMRLHLDACPIENGALRLVPGSHRYGVLRRNEIAVEAQKPAEIVAAEAGDAVLMRPLALHASSSARTPSHRRVLHLEFAPANLLPGQLRWAEA